MARSDDLIATIAQLRRDVDEMQRLGASRWGVTAETWHLIGSGGEPAFQNSWVNFGGTNAVAAFRREGSRIFVEGLIKSGASGTVAFTLPAGYRPVLVKQRPIRTVNSVDGLGIANVLQNGDVTITALAGTGTITAAAFGFDFATD